MAFRDVERPERFLLAFAVKVRGLVGAEFKVDKPTPEVEPLAKYAGWALYSPEGKRRHRDGPLFKVPHKLDFEHLVPIETEVVDGVTKMRLPRPLLRHREGFALTDQGYDLERALDHANYCIWCHNQGKDSCSRGLKDRKTGAFQKSPFGVTLAGCPLEEKISEMNLLKSEGFSIGALAIAAVDNPLLAATGHRICNDCMKACIYQKQEPVDIPQVETRALTDVLDLPWGFEIYSLLTRWNPLDLRRPVPLDPGRVVVARLRPGAPPVVGVVHVQFGHRAERAFLHQQRFKLTPEIGAHLIAETGADAAGILQAVLVVVAEHQRAHALWRNIGWTESRDGQFLTG